jgi:hypothetical protein
MQNVPHSVLGIDNFGNKQMMIPGGEYQFQGNEVFEMPVMKEGGIPQRYKTMGFSRVGQKKSGDGQHKWKVLAKKGDSYKVVQGGYRGMQDFKQHGSEDRKDRFWDRMGGRNSSKAKDPFSPLYWHKRFGTWEYGGPVEMQGGGWSSDQQASILQNTVQGTSTGTTSAHVPSKIPGQKFYNAKNFNERFRAARNAGMSEFEYKDKSYNTKLIPKEYSDEYLQSKKFLEDYIKNTPSSIDTSFMGKVDYDKYEKEYLKRFVPKSWTEAYDSVKNLPAYQSNGNDYIKLNDYLEKISEQEDLVKKNIETLSPDYYQYLDSAIKQEKLKSLNTPSYFSITTQKPKDMSEDGYWDPKQTKLFIEASPENYTTSVHELAHKANQPFLSRFSKNIPIPTPDMINQNRGAYGINSSESYDYLSNPTEVESRKMSALYAAKKKGIAVDENFVRNLRNNRKTLPYDIGQLLDLYGPNEETLLHYLTDGKYGKKEFAQGGMIKRADGSYSKRGLWDNIRANAGSGKQPTKEMLKQEKKIRGAEKKEYGGWLDQYQSGGVASIDSNTPTGVSVGTQPYQDWEHRPIPTSYISDKDRQIQALRMQQENTPAIGAQPTWQQKVHHTTGKIARAVAPGNYALIPEMLMYPANAVANLSQPSKYYEGKQGYAGFEGYNNMVNDISAVAPALKISKNLASKGVEQLYNNPAVRNVVDNVAYNVVDKISDIPANNKYLQPYYKRAAYNVMSGSGNATRDWKDIIKQTLRSGNYKGDRGLGMLSTSDKIRDLPKLYIYGDEKGFIKNKLKPIGIERYEKKYGPLNSYDLEMIKEPNYRGYTEEAVNEMLNKINGAIAEKGVYAKGVGEGSGALKHYSSADDIAGHMNYVYKDPTDKLRLRIQDIWKFDPDDYAKRWSSDVMNPKGGLKSRIQARLVEKAGKPFILSKDYPLELTASSEADIAEIAKEASIGKKYAEMFKGTSNKDIMDEFLKKYSTYKRYGGWLDQYQSGGQIRYTNSVNQPIAPTVSQNPTTPGKLDPQEQAAIQRRLYELQANQKMYQRPTDYRTPAEKQYYEQKRITELEREGLTPEGYPTGRTKVNRALDPVAGLIEKGIDASVVYDAGLLGAKGLRTLAKKVGSKISIPKGYTGPMMTDVVPFEPTYPTSPYRPPGGRTFPVLPARTPTGMPTLVDVPELTKEQQILKGHGLNYKNNTTTGINTGSNVTPLSEYQFYGNSPTGNITNNITSSSKPVSEINWGKWNKEIPDNKLLMDEYHTIEQTAKANGSWMKNPDGSAFQGTPEQFVQQNSQNFKNAFGKTKFVDKHGKPIILHHGHFTDKDFSSFVPSGISGISNSGYEGNYSFFTPHKSLAEDYAGIGQGLDNLKEDGYKSYIKSVYLNSENPLLDARTEFADINIPKSLREGKDAIVASLDPAKFSEVAVPYGNNVKSAIGNNGMFNMKNRNIYKTLLPLGIGAAALSQQDNKQYGGWLSKYK